MTQNPDAAGKKSLQTITRKKITFSPTNLIRTSFLEDCENYPLVITPENGDVDLVNWAKSSRSWIEQKLSEHGAILFRDFRVAEIEQFEDLVAATSEGSIEYNERAAVRQSVGNKVYTSTEYPADQPIPLHHEMSYSHNYPAKIWFYCSIPAATLGATPIADDRKVYELIPARIKQLFEEKKVMYVRNYGEGLDLSWQEVFQTDSRAAVEEYCRASQMLCEWRDGDKLRTKAIRNATIDHPRTGDRIWFNHAHLFHHSNIQAEVRDLLLEQYREDELPRNAMFGDGSLIETSILDEIRHIYNETSVRFDWQKGDVLMVDNFLSSHGREPFTGKRETLVAMAEIHANLNI